MSKTTIGIVIAIVIVAVLVGVYFIYNYSATQQGQNTNAKVFDVQGMKVEILREGEGVAAKNGDYVTTHYVGTLEDGKEFDSSVRRNVPFTFPLGQGRVIKGWDLGILGMKVGEQRKLAIPYELAYGADGFPPTIPQKANLTFVVTLLGINPGTTTGN